MSAIAISADTRSESEPQALGRNASGGILSAIDGSPESLAAVKTAFALASARKSAVHIVSVIPAFASYRRAFKADESQSEINSLRINIREVAVRKVIEKANPLCAWTLEIVTGRVAREVVATAERLHAEMIVIGRRHQNPLDKLLGGETTLEIVRMTSIPVLAVGDTFLTPTSVVVATDFSAASTRAARLAVQLFGNHGSLYLVHVDPGLEPELEEYGLRERRHSPGDFSSLFRKQREEIQAPPDILIENVTLSGKPAERILYFARTISADVVACGPHGRNGLERFLLGSVSTALLRNSSCALLIAPPDPQKGDYR